MQSSVLQLIIQAKDEATKKLEALSKSAKSIEPVFKGMALAGTAAFVGIASFAASSIKSAREAETAQLQLEHAVLKVSKATKEQLQQTSALADELERKGVLDGDSIKIGLAQLSTFGLSNKAVQGLGGALSDLAVNQFGVNASGEQLAGTANMIAKALNGQFGVLEKSGIRFSEAQINAIKFGTEMQKVAAINEGFAQNLKYTNEVALKGFDGQLAKINVQFDNLKTAIGQQLLPILTQLITQITPIVQKILDWVAANPELTKNILIVSAAVSAFIAVVGLLGLAIPAITAGITALGTALMFLAANPIGIAIVAIAALIAIGIAVVKNWEYISATFMNIWEGIKTFIVDVLAVIVGIIMGTLDILLPNWQTHLQALSTAWTYAWTFMKEQLGYIWDGIKITVQAGLDYLSNLYEPFFKQLEKLLELIDKVKNAAKDVGGKFLESQKGGLGVIKDGIKDAYSKGKQALKVNDAIISPNGRVITTNPSDYLIATQNPSALGGGGGSITVNINGGTYLSEDVAQEIGNMIIKQFKRTVRI